jgi:hypothetical protein
VKDIEMGQQDVHQSSDIQVVCNNLSELHQRVARFWGRIEVTNASGETCVLISKAELDSIERALEILCELPGNDSICKELTRISHLCRTEESTEESIEPGASPTLFPSSFDDRIGA